MGERQTLYTWAASLALFPPPEFWMDPFPCASQLPVHSLLLGSHSSSLLPPPAWTLSLQPKLAKQNRNCIALSRALLTNANLSFCSVFFSRCPKYARKGASCCKVDLRGLTCFPWVIKCTLSYLGNYIHTLLQINKMSFLLFNIVQFKAIVSRYLVPPLFRISGSFTKRNNYLPWKQKQNVRCQNCTGCGPEEALRSGFQTKLWKFRV